MPLKLGRVVLSSIADAANRVIMGNKERVVQSRAERIWQRIPKAPFCYLGWGLLGVWTNLVYLSPAFDFLALPIQSRSAFDLVVVAVMLVVAVVVWARPSVSPLARKKWAAPLAFTLMQICTFMNFVLFSIGVALTLGAVGAALMMLMLSEFFGFIHPKRTVLYIAWSWLVGSICVIFIRVLPFAYVWACMVAAPVVVTLCMWRSYKTLTNAELSFSSDRRSSFPWLPIVPIALCAVMKRCVNVMAPIGVPAWAVNDVGMLLAGAIILLGLAIYRGNMDLRSLWGVSVGGMAFAIAFLCVSVFGGSTICGFFAAVISTVSYQILFILMTAIFANMAYRYGLCALWLFSIEHAVNMTSGSCAEVGMEVLQASTLVDPGVLVSLFAVFSAVALAVISLLFAKFSPDSLWGLSLEEEGSFGENERLRYACERIVKAHGLTQREGEVLLMCVKGKKPAAIASELFIEVSTARTHIKHLYTKLDVHSSKELIGFVTEVANRVGFGNAAD